MSSKPIYLESRQRCPEEKIAEQYVNFLTVQARQTAMKHSQGKKASEEDKITFSTYV